MKTIFQNLKRKLKGFLVNLIDIYQIYISIYLRPSCVFYPTCSEYTKQAIIKYGALYGVYIGFLRILRCHPWQNNHIDPVP